MSDAPCIDVTTTTVAPGRASALGLVVGPLVFVGGWAVLGASIDGFSPVGSAISEVAAVDSPRRWAMGSVFVFYGVALLIGSVALRRSGAGGSSTAAVVNGLAVWGVAAFPLHGSGRGDVIHGGFALLGYLSLSAMPLLAAGPLHDAGRRGAAVASVVAGVACAGSLAATRVDDRTGLFQRIGTTTGNVWILAAGVVLLMANRPQGGPSVSG